MPPDTTAADAGGLALERLLTVDQVAELLQEHRKTVERKARAGELPGVVRPGGRAVRFRADALRDWIGAGCPPLKPVGRATDPPGRKKRA